ncbi:MBL fold metallo-hydrolase [Streptomyces iranensis]|uniref:Coenzyme PQQ synthesis protein B n=1 Tax=Streptomyces iranensis TaxID=576784 RepID=A0A060ZF89_9ACTN|nr:MBL fold metallo-hydrolase [Streptomyces iranensis]MBP2062027.1 pyrroloquinoline quinone biosynthesis protein B [Streptomyces iranensis]CDR03973.1 Coenzyme PQQ synthesis protein B [Streptomyces iranensis]
MRVRVLGTAAGGGVPQWNCACPGCSGARAHPGWRRRHASLAVQADEGRWYLVNATPDLGDQVEDCPELHPGPEPRRTPLAGVILTDAELDHTLGIARLREADGIEILATAPVRHALLTGLHLGEVLTPYARLDWRPLGPGDRPLSRSEEVRYGSAAPRRGAGPYRYPAPPRGATSHDGAADGQRRIAALPAERLAEGSPIAVGAVPVSAKRPRYAAGLDAPDDDAWVVALRLTDRATGRSLLYAPALAAWPDAFQLAAEEADCVIVDGTFWSDDEPLTSGFGSRTATAMGHLPIDGPDGTAHRLAALGARTLYTHLNNTNPLNDPAAPQHSGLARLGVEVAADGMVIDL